MFERIGAMRVISSVLSDHGLSPKDLPESHFYALGFIAIGLKEKGLSKKQAVDAIRALCQKHGSLPAVLSFYSEMFGIPKTSEEELLGAFMSVTGSIADSLGVGGIGAEQIRTAALNASTIRQKQELAEKAYKPIEPSVPSHYRLASFVAKDNDVAEEVIVDLIRQGKILGKIVEGYWRVDTREPIDSRVVHSYLAKNNDTEKESSEPGLVDSRNSEVAHASVSAQDLAEALEGLQDGQSGEDELLMQFLEQVESETDTQELLSEQQLEVVRSIIVALRDRGMSEGSTLKTLLKLVRKYGTIGCMIGRYSYSPAQSEDH